MSIQRIGGKDVSSFVGNLELLMEKVDIKIDDKRAVAYSRGIANGFVDGECSASGSFTLDTQNFDMLLHGLVSDGESWKDVKPQDIHLFAGAGDLTKDIKAFGCLLKVSDLWGTENKGGEKAVHVIPFEVTSPDFIHVDGKPYLSLNETYGIF